MKYVYYSVILTEEEQHILQSMVKSELLDAEQARVVGIYEPLCAILQKLASSNDQLELAAHR